MVRYGFERTLIVLRRGGFKDMHKGVYRAHYVEVLDLSSKRPGRSRIHCLDRVDAPVINRVWSMDFLLGALFNGQRIRILAIVVCYSKECLTLLLGKSLRGEYVRNEFDPSLQRGKLLP
jgi:putative transposase